MEMIGTHSLPLDAETGHHHPGFLISDTKYGLWATFFNATNKKIYVYDWHKRQMLQSISVPQRDSVGLSSNDADAPFVDLNGQIFYYAFNNYGIYRLSNDRFLSFYKNVDVENMQSAAYFDFITINPFNPVLFLNDSSFFLSNDISVRRIQDFNKLMSLQHFTIESGVVSLRRLVPSHSVYNKGNWGRAIGYQAYHCFNHDSSAIITSFGKSDSLIITNLQDNSRMAAYAGCDFFKMSEQTPLSKNHILEESSFEEGVKYDFTHPCYFSIQYDPISARYYRLTQYAFPTKEVVTKNNGEIRIGISYSIIVLNKDFKKMAEVTLPMVEDLNMNYFFARDGVIYIAPLPKYQPYEDSLVFNKYQIRL